MRTHQHGTTLVVGLLLLTLVTLLGLAGAGTARIEAQLAHNEQFRENAASAASAGVEVAISRIVTTPEPASATFSTSATLPDTASRFDVQVRFLGFDVALPQATGANLAGAHFEIISTGYSSRRAVDRQRAIVMRVDAAAVPVAASDCEPAIPSLHCHVAGELMRLSWQRLVPP